MAALALYSNAYVYINGGLLTQEASVSVDKDPKLTPVKTTVLGLGGVVIGGPTVEVTIESAVPSADFEFNPDAFMRLGQVVECKVVMASRTSVFKGFIMGATYSHQVDDASKLQMKLLCRYGDFE